jgi:glutamate dehydrogenase
MTADHLSSLTVSTKNLIQETVRYATKKFKDKTLQEFIPIFYGKLPYEDLAEYMPEDLAHIAYNMVRTAQTAPLPVINIYNPTKESHGWDSPHTILGIVFDQLPFLVDSVCAALQNQKHTIYLLIRSSFENKSLLYIELYDQLETADMEGLRENLISILKDVAVAVSDWHPMKEKIAESIQDITRDKTHFKKDEQAEIECFLKWLSEGSFTFLGYREYLFKPDSDKIKISDQLGILKTFKQSFFGPTSQTEEEVLAYKMKRENQFLSFTKTMVKSTVHRDAPLDIIRLVKLDEKGQAIGERQFFGLFTSDVYNKSLRNIPLLRRKVDLALEKTGVQMDSYEGRAFVHILESFPREELFQTDVTLLAEMGNAILHLKERQRLVLFVRSDPLGHFVSCLVYVPKDRYSALLRIGMGDVLARCLKGKVVSFQTQMGADLPMARVLYTIATEPRLEDTILCDVKSTEKALSYLSLSWEDRLKETFIERMGQRQARLVTKTFEGAFSAAYQENFTPAQAAHDIKYVEEALKEGTLKIQAVQSEEEGRLLLNLKLFHPKKPMILSDIFPILENIGFKVLTETPYEIQGVSQEMPVWLHHFTAYPLRALDAPLAEIQPHLIHCLSETWEGRVENDALNQLVLVANLATREVVVLRAYSKYMHQLRWNYSSSAIASCLSYYPVVTKLLIDLFVAQFDPEKGERSLEKRILAALEIQFDQVINANDEAILRGFLNLIQSTLRTNYFQNKPYISFKFQSDLLRDLEDTKPLYEVFVYAPWMEGIHLRGDRVARGGIRWSDRREDYRKEVLELMKAQNIKNVVIVPRGAKGGFIVKKFTPDVSYQDNLQEGIRCYKTLISGLLDITDNLVKGKVVPPLNVKRRDGDDHYLVVAADKGTATFSDIANELSQEYNFWMGDAFASGGSQGYDHKKMGITSRGAWESVKRHFRELEQDIENHPFTVTGVGDMAGDVFGNGMLFSKQIKLVAAFNHAHIFLDPKPDPSKSYEERKRLFDLPRSTWGDYDPKVLSKGGMVFERAAKTVTLTPEIQKLLNLTQKTLTPNELIQLILRHPVDLLWLGGIGTFVKGQEETNAEVGDRANDALRINGRELGCKVVGEGANLGFTQLGRLEYAAKGGKLNRDTIDNSAGVDCSDHEVNIKILFQGVDISFGERNKILEQMTDEVAALVLRDNYLQTQAISMIEVQGYEALPAQAHLMMILEKEGFLNRQALLLSSSDAMERRHEEKQGLIRPEISLLLACVKLFVFKHIMASKLLDSPILKETLFSYFPKALQEKFPEAIENHPLKREIIATMEANNLVNRMGLTFVTEIMKQNKVTATEVIEAYIKVRSERNFQHKWAEIEELDGTVNPKVQEEKMLKVVEEAENFVSGRLKK